MRKQCIDETRHGHVQSLGESVELGDQILADLGAIHDTPLRSVGGMSSKERVKKKEGTWEVNS